MLRRRIEMFAKAMFLLVMLIGQIFQSGEYILIESFSYEWETYGTLTLKWLPF